MSDRERHWEEFLTLRARGAGRLPNLIGVGAGRSGTWSLYLQLARTPGIYMSPVKELGYFSTRTREEKPNGWTVEDYKVFFAEADSEPYVGEISPQYLHHPMAPLRISQTCLDPRIIIQYRDPVDRFLSHYRHLHHRHGIGSVDEFVRRPSTLSTMTCGRRASTLPSTCFARASISRLRPDTSRPSARVGWRLSNSGISACSRPPRAC